MRDLAHNLIKFAKAKGITVATAESCTGGGIGAALTAVAGSSEVFMGGAIVYANRAKADVLNVPPALLVEHGAVSEPVAAAMASGAQELFKVDLAVSVTGIAGPGGGTARKPVGLVYVAVASEEEVWVKELHLGNVGREVVRAQTIDQALIFLSNTISEM